MKQNVDYGYDVQRIYLEMMLADAQTYVRCKASLTPRCLIENYKSLRSFCNTM
jgi:hypothetical protein